MAPLGDDGLAMLRSCDNIPTIRQDFAHSSDLPQRLGCLRTPRMISIYPTASPGFLEDKPKEPVDDVGGEGELGEEAASCGTEHDGEEASVGPNRPSVTP